MGYRRFFLTGAGAIFITRLIALLTIDELQVTSGLTQEVVVGARSTKT